ncbi:TorF family putative porin [Rivibacter subsaxonicus]|uniref:Uncharacterized protein (TIGR02001 family) n=1 Tax=Rivibacter subsaxonicus TaxID=457575 RepID=A0A4Q7VWH7_9BURK|nr:TorF family putative porin [Rivibacter subsaxonicus]RZU01092.1 uncharacterized protein (TIGR02001 family) [Rivibacter subsaxonicus]
MIKRTHVALAAALALSSLSALAQTAAAPTPDWSVTGNAGLYSDYRFRGFTQTGYGPAFQGGFDVAHSSGFYLGNWNSNVEQALFNGASLEMDFYGGYKMALGDFGLDLGYIYYFYPKSGALDSTKISNGELYVGGSYGPISAKWYIATTHFFAIGKPPSYADVDTKGSWYLDLSGSFPLADGWAISAHYGYQSIKDGTQVGLIDDSVSDYKLGVTKDLSGWLLGLAVVGTSEKDLFTTAESGFTKGGGKTGVVASLGKTF